METHSRWLVILLAAALVLGAIVTALAPGYRRTAICLATGRPEEGPIWRSNAGFYREVRLRDRGATRHDAE